MLYPKISIITICYNAAEVIEKTITSVVNQTYPNVEYIIVDGASTDTTLQVVNKYKDKISTISSEPDRGIYDAMNKGIALATGQWINFMNAGDCLATDDILEKIFIKDAQKVLNCSVIYGDVISVKANRQEIYHTVVKPFWENTSAVAGMGFNHQTVFVKTNVAKAFGFNLKYKICADFDMMYRLFKGGHKFYYEPLAIARFDSENGISAMRWKEAMKEDAQIRGVYSKLSFKIYFFYMIIMRNHTVKAWWDKIKQLAPGPILKLRNKMWKIVNS